jgi:cytochrome c553
MSSNQKKYLFYFFLFSLGFLIAVSEWGCTKHPVKEEKRKIIGFNIREGIHYCAPCHGENADGSGRYFPSYIDPQPTNFVNSDYLKKTDKDVIFQAIKYGSAVIGKSNFSPSYGETLRDEEIDYIIEYLKLLKKNQEEENKKEQN